MEEKQKGTKFWTKKVWNRRWEIWLSYFMASTTLLLLLFLGYVYYVTLQPEFVLNNTMSHQTCHHYNDKIYCCDDYSKITVFINASKNVTEHYICWAVKFKTLKEPFIRGVADYDGLVYD